MQNADRLKRLMDTQERLRKLEQIEREMLLVGLRKAEVAYKKALAGISGATGPDLEYLATHTKQLSRSLRNVETAQTRVDRQTGKLLERSVVANAIGRLLAQAIQREDRAREAYDLANVIDRIAVRAINRVAQD